MMMHSKANRDECPQLNDGHNPTMAIIENHHFKQMAQVASHPRLRLQVTLDVGQFSTHNEVLTAELCPDCTAAAKAVEPAYLS